MNEKANGSGGHLITVVGVGDMVREMERGEVDRRRERERDLMELQCCLRGMLMSRSMQRREVRYR